MLWGMTGEVPHLSGISTGQFVHTRIPHKFRGEGCTTLSIRDFEELETSYCYLNTVILCPDTTFFSNIFQGCTCYVVVCSRAR